MVAIFPLPGFIAEKFRGWLNKPNCFKEREMSEVDVFPSDANLAGGNSNIFYFHPETWGR